MGGGLGEEVAPFCVVDQVAIKCNEYSLAKATIKRIKQLQMGDEASDELKSGPRWPTNYSANVTVRQKNLRGIALMKDG